MLLAIATVLSTMHFEGQVTADGGDYATVDFPVPAGTTEIQVAHTDGDDFVILDWGVWDEAGTQRGWGGGLVDDAVIGVDESSRGYLTGPIGEGTWQVVIGKAKLGADGGHYSIDVTCRDAPTLTPRPRADWTPVVLSTEKRWYAGDFHVHSTESGDAHASIADDLALAKAQGLDFVELSDHNTLSQVPLEAAQQGSAGVLVIRGSEITTYSGHANGVGISRYVDHRLGYNGRTVNDIVAEVIAQGGDLIVNHPAEDLGDACIGCKWEHESDTSWANVSGIEILTAGYDISQNLFTPQVIALWDRIEDRGIQLAAVGGSDDHTGGLNEGSTGAPVGHPCTRVLADQLSEQAIVEALHAHRTLVQLRGCTDPMVDVSIPRRDGSIAGIGETANSVETATLSIHVTGGDGTFAQVYRNGVMLSQTAVVGADATIVVADHPEVLDTRYRVELVDDAGRRIVVTSHLYASLYIDLGDDDGGDGFCDCRTTSPAGLASLAPMLLLLRRRRIRT